MGVHVWQSFVSFFGGLRPSNERFLLGPLVSYSFLPLITACFAAELGPRNAEWRGAEGHGKQLAGQATNGQRI